MTDMKKTAKDKAPAKRKTLQVNKETLKDLTAKDPRQLKGGRVPPYLEGHNQSGDPGCG